jgi:hypothetical protein
LRPPCSRVLGTYSIFNTGLRDAEDENTRTDAVIAACEHARQDRRAKEQALEHPDMTPELVEVLSTREIGLRDDVSTSIEVE